MNNNTANDADIIERAREFMKRRGANVSLDNIYARTLLDFCSEELAGQSAWVKFSDRFPDENGEYLITERVGLNRESLTVETYYVHDGKWYADETDFIEEPQSGGEIKPDGEFVAWMPIPPFQEADDE